MGNRMGKRISLAIKRIGRTILTILPDKLYIKILYAFRMKKLLHFHNIKTYNEKLQWLKLYDRNPLYTLLVDKYAVKEYVSKKIGAEYVIPTIGIWNNFDDIDFDILPNQFVLKCTHDSGGLCICHDKQVLDWQVVKKKICTSLKKNFYYYGREWPYKNVKPRIIAEPYLEDKETGELRDYKFFCFDGKVKALFIATDRQKTNEDTKFDFFDENFNHLPIRQGHPNAVTLPKKPINFEKMKELATVLSAGIPHVRVDFYEVNGKVFFGEMTFYHFSGFEPFIPEDWDYKLGEWLKLPTKKSQ